MRASRPAISTIAERSSASRPRVPRGPGETSWKTTTASTAAPPSTKIGAWSAANDPLIPTPSMTIVIVSHQTTRSVASGADGASEARDSPGTNGVRVASSEVGDGAGLRRPASMIPTRRRPASRAVTAMMVSWSGT